MKKNSAKSKFPQDLVLARWAVSELMRPFDQHLDNQELDALVAWSSENGRESQRLSPEAIRQAELHLLLCVGCKAKVSKYQLLVRRFSNAELPEAAPRRADCPKEEDVDWREVAAGLWSELKARRLIMHAALCDHCGPMLRAAVSLNNKPTPEEEKFLAEVKVPSRPAPIAPVLLRPPPPRRFVEWLVPAAALIVMIAVLITHPLSSPAPLSGPKYAEFAVKTHRQHAQGGLPLEVHSDSQQTLNEWFQSRSQFPLAFPASPAVPGEERPYRLEGARLLQVGAKTAVFIAYQVQTPESQAAQMQTTAASLMVTPDSVAVASGGVEVDFNKVSFHYAMIDGYKVVTWSVHGLTYALVSREGNNSQASCMVCHSAMRDRDLSHTPTPLHQQTSNTLNPVAALKSF
jgi:hypothetical protein